MMKKFNAAIQAVYKKYYEYLRNYLKKGNPMLCDEDGRTLLMHSVLDSQSDTGIVEFLLDSGEQVNESDRHQNWTNLHFASREKKNDIVQILIQHGASISAVDSFGNTPLARSLDSLPFDEKTISILLRAGANPEKKNNYGVSPPK